MFVKEKEMYHFHHIHLFKDIWYVGNKIIVDDNFESSYLNILKYFNTTVNTDMGNRVEFNRIISTYLMTDQDKETYIEMLKDARKIIEGINIFKRELALEEIRNQKYQDLPSRKHSMWLCDEIGRDFWSEELKSEEHRKLDLYKVLVSGNLFKSSASFLPKNNSNYEQNLIEAENYWNPNFKILEEKQKGEYLFQGEVKILEKINKY